MILAVGTGMIGGTLGYVLGLLTKRFLSPSVKELNQTIEANDRWYKQTMGRMKSRFKEYEQPSELQQMAAGADGMEQGDLVSMVIQNIGGIKSLPRWVRPFLPAIQSYIKENPDKVAALIKQFTNQGMRGQSEELKSEDSL